MQVYGLYDPITGELRYIGKTKCAKTRLSIHLSPSHLSKRNHRVNWIKSVLAKGLKPEFRILEDCHSDMELVAAERRWIAKLRSEGARLTNSTDGGEGAPGAKLSAEHKRKISEAHKGKVISESHRKRLSEVHKGAKRPPRTRSYSINASKAHGGRSFLDENGNIYDVLSDAVSALGVDGSSVCRVLHGHLTHTKGHVFRFLDEGAQQLRDIGNG